MLRRAGVCPNAQEILDRLTASSWSVYRLDQAAVRQALETHWRHLMQQTPMPPLRWITDYSEVLAVAKESARTAEIPWVKQASLSAGAAKTIWVAGAAEAAWIARAAGTARAVEAASTARAAWDAEAAWTSRAAGVAEVAQAAGFVEANEAAWAAEVAWTARAARDAEAAKAALLHYYDIWIPFLRAHEAGLFFAWFFDREILCVDRPILHLVNNRLHREAAPAVEWPDGRAFYFWHGVRMEPWMIRTPAERLEAPAVLAITNVEQRTACIQRIGVERMLQHLQPKTLDTWQDYTLLELRLNERPCRYLKMKNPSLGVWHVEGVPNACRTVAEALHSRKPKAMQAIPVSDQGEQWYEQGDVCVWPKGAASLQAYPAILT